MAFDARILEVVRRFGHETSDAGQAVIHLRGVLAPLALDAHKGVRKTLTFSKPESRNALDQFLGGGDPSEHLLTKLMEAPDEVRAALDAIHRGQPASAVQAVIREARERRRVRGVPLGEDVRAMMAQLGLPGRTPPEAGIGVVLIDYDKTIGSGDSHMGLIKRGLLTHTREMLRLPAPVQRLWNGVQMGREYHAHTLAPEIAAARLGRLLDKVPVLPVARDWADVVAGASLKRNVLDRARQLSIEIVRREWDAKIAAGQMAGPVQQNALETEAMSRLVIVSSQFTRVLQMLTDVGPTHENLLGVNPWNIIGSEGTFTEDERFKDDGKLRYCFGENKPRFVIEAFEKREVTIDPDQVYVLTDDYYYDGPLLQMARKPSHRILVDPDSRDSVYARGYGTEVIVDQWDELTRGRWVPGKRQGRKRFEVLDRRRFFFDTRAQTTNRDAWDRAIFGAVDMLPAAAMGWLSHADDPVGMRIAVAALPLAAGLVYGPMNRRAKSHLAAGAAVMAGALATQLSHTGIHVWPILGRLAGAGAGLATAHGVAERVLYRPAASNLGPKAFGRFSWRLWHHATRVGVTALWAEAVQWLSHIG